MPALKKCLPPPRFHPPPPPPVAKKRHGPPPPPHASIDLHTPTEGAGGAGALDIRLHSYQSIGCGLRFCGRRRAPPPPRSVGRYTVRVPSDPHPRRLRGCVGQRCPPPPPPTRPPARPLIARHGHAAVPGPPRPRPPCPGPVLPLLHPNGACPTPKGPDPPPPQPVAHTPRTRPVRHCLAASDAFEGKGPQRGPRRRLGRRLEEVAKAAGGGYCRLQMPLRLAVGVRGTVAGHRLGALEGGGQVPLPLSNASLLAARRPSAPIRFLGYVRDQKCSGEWSAQGPGGGGGGGGNEPPKSGVGKGLFGPTARPKSCSLRRASRPGGGGRPGGWTRMRRPVGTGCLGGGGGEPSRVPPPPPSPCEGAAPALRRGAGPVEGAGASPSSARRTGQAQATGLSAQAPPPPRALG